MNIAVHLEAGFFISLFLLLYKSHFFFCTCTTDRSDEPWESKAMHTYGETLQSGNSLEDRSSKVPEIGLSHPGVDFPG